MRGPDATGAAGRAAGEPAGSAYPISPGGGTQAPPPGSGGAVGPPGGRTPAPSSGRRDPASGRRADPGSRRRGLPPWLRSLRRAAALLFVLASPAAAQIPAADSAWSQGDYHAARIAYERALHDDPGSVRALYRLGILASWDGRLDSALALLRDARELAPGDPDVRLAEARVLAWRGRYRAALARYDSLLAEQPDNREAALGRAQTLAWAGRYQDAARAYRMLGASDSTDLAAQAGEAQVTAWRGDLARAGALYERALARDSSHVPSLTGLAQVRLWQARHREARSLLDRALTLAPEDRAARDLDRAIRAATRPDLEVALGWSRDSDRNTSWWQTAAGSAGLGQGVRGFASVGVTESSDPARNATRTSAEAGLRLARGKASATAALGLRRLDPEGAPRRTPATWRASARYRLSPRAVVGAGYAHSALDETAFLVGRGLDLDELSADLDLAFSDRLTFGAGGGYGWLTDDNRRASFVAALMRRIGNRAGAGLSGRYLGYEFRGVGYFSPDRFLVGEARGWYALPVHRWEARFAGGLGLQQVGAAGAAQSQWHLETRISRRWGSRNEVSLSGGISNSAVSSTTGAFRSYTAALQARVGL